MKLTFHRLFLKIFPWFWATVIATGMALVLTFMLQRGSVPARWHQMMENAASYAGRVAVAEMEVAGPGAVSSYLEVTARESQLDACLFDGNGAAVAGEQCAMFGGMARQVAASGAPDFSIRRGIAQAAVMLTGGGGRKYIFATELPAGPRETFGDARSSFLLEWGVALAVSGVICYFLTRYLTAPIVELREAARQLARGELGTRAAPGMEKRRDELGDLVGDFNAMADRIEQLISSQRQLIYDVSHELRSPLARLHVALDLVREKKGKDAALDPTLDQIGQDLETLSDMTGRLLTVARLDTSPAAVPFGRVDLAELVERIVRDARFESRGGAIGLSMEGEVWVRGNAELLDSAIENVVRNAVRHTAEGTAVEVRLEEAGEGVRIEVRDYGPGVPEEELGSILRPFYRVQGARDRESGGVGLGLAIAERVVRLHGGRIWAVNARPGLVVRMDLPRRGEDVNGYG